MATKVETQNQTMKMVDSKSFDIKDVKDFNSVVIEGDYSKVKPGTYSNGECTAIKHSAMEIDGKVGNPFLNVKYSSTQGSFNIGKAILTHPKSMQTLANAGIVSPAFKFKSITFKSIGETQYGTDEIVISAIEGEMI